jgi:hypothetical protein
MVRCLHKAAGCGRSNLIQSRGYGPPRGGTAISRAGQRFFQRQPCARRGIADGCSFPEYHCGRALTSTRATQEPTPPAYHRFPSGVPASPPGKREYWHHLVARLSHAHSIPLFYQIYRSRPGDSHCLGPRPDPCSSDKLAGPEVWNCARSGEDYPARYPVCGRWPGWHDPHLL